MHKPRLLIIDDDQNLVELLRHRMERDGFEVLSALSGTEGFKMALRSRPDLLIMDVMLPDIDGLTILNELRVQDGLGRLPVIVLSAYNELEYLGLALAAGVAEYWLKSRTNAAEISARAKGLLKKRTNFISS